MIWLAPALGAMLLSAAIVTVDKIVIERYLRNGWTYPLVTSLLLCLYCALILAGRAAVGRLHVPSLTVLFIALLPGVLQYFGGLLFTRALLRADAAVATGMNQISPLFSLGWGVLLLGETLVGANYAGVLLVVTCAVLLALDWDTQAARGWQLNAALWLVLLTALLRSLSDLCLKLGLGQMDTWDVFGLSRIAVLAPLGLTLTRREARQLFWPVLRPLGLRFLLLIAAVEGLVVLAIYLMVQAFATGPLALVSASQSTVPMFILLLTALLNRRWPGLVPVRPRRGGWWVQALLCAGIVVGVYLLRQ